MFPARAQPLAYPAGRRPNFDPTHPWARRGAVRFVGVPTGGTITNILIGQTSFVGGGNGTSTVSPIGRSIKDPTAQQFISYSTSAPPGVTLGAIAMQTSSSNNCGVMANSGVTANGLQMFASLSGTMTAQVGGSNKFSSITLANNVPYFLGISAVVNTSLVFFAVRLDNGQISVDTSQAPGAGSLTSDGVYIMGDYSGQNLPFQGYLGPTFVVETALSVDEFKAGARDPMGFWFRRTPLYEVGAAAAAAANAKLALLGVG